MKNEAASRTSSPPEPFVESERVVDTIVVGALGLHRAGICARMPDGAMVTGSAACASGDPAPRAEFEVRERVATLEAIRDRETFTLRDADGSAIGLLPRTLLFPESDQPTVWRPARSSGVALHDGWATARDRAWWELCERDRVIRAWHGQGRPRLLAPTLDPRLAATSSVYAWHIAMFDAPSGVAPVEVAGVFGFPRGAAAPLVVGYAARPSSAQAIEAAAGEALQSLAFLWGEEIPSEPPPAGPTAMHHLERLIWPGSQDAIRRWLHDGHAEHAAGSPGRSLERADGFVDLTPTWLEGGARVVRAFARDARPLEFGESPSTRHLPAHLRLHPIP